MGLWDLMSSGLDEWEALEKKSANMDILGGVWEMDGGIKIKFFVDSLS